MSVHILQHVTFSKDEISTAITEVIGVENSLQNLIGKIIRLDENVQNNIRDIATQRYEVEHMKVGVMEILGKIKFNSLGEFF